MIKAEIVLCPLEAFLDGPAQAGSPGGFRKAGAGRTADHVACQPARVPAAAAHQHPVLPACLAPPWKGDAGPVMQAKPLDPSPAGWADQASSSRVRAIIRRDAGLQPAGRIIGPALRKIQVTVNQRLAIPARIAEKHTHLAVLDPPRRPRMLT